MLIRRWQANEVPSLEQMKLIFRAEGLVPEIEEYDAGVFIEEHRHPFDEIRMVVTGEIMLKISGNQLLLRPGDRIDIPSNTRHSMNTLKGISCTCICAKRPF